MAIKSFNLVIEILMVDRRKLSFDNDALFFGFNLVIEILMVDRGVNQTYQLVAGIVSIS